MSWQVAVREQLKGMPTVTPRGSMVTLGMDTRYRQGRSWRERACGERVGGRHLIMIPRLETSNPGATRRVPVASAVTFF